MDWAIAIELAGSLYRFATEELEIDGKLYQAGLEDFKSSKVVDLNEQLQIRINSSHDWAQIFNGFRNVVHGGKATIYLVDEEEASEWFRGTVRNTSWGASSQDLTCSIVAIHNTFPFPDERMVVDQETQPDNNDVWASGGSTIYKLWTGNASKWVGWYYPLVIGYPGYRGPNSTPLPTVPCPVVQTATGNVDIFDPTNPTVPKPTIGATGYVVAVAGGNVEANSSSTIWVQDMSLDVATDVGDVEPVDTYTLHSSMDGRWYKSGVSQSAGDKLNQKYVGFEKAGVFGGEPEYKAAFSPGCGGLLWRGEVMRGAADIFEWGALTYTDLRIDKAKLSANRMILNAYRFDTFVNEATDFVEWYMDTVLEHIPATIARGERGFYLAYMPNIATTRQSILDITVYSPDDVDSFNAEPISEQSSISSDVSGLVNEITVKYQPAESGYVQTFILTSEFRKMVRLPGGGAFPDNRTILDKNCRASQVINGVVKGEKLLDDVWDDATAYQIAKDYAADNALPKQTVSYSMDVKYRWLCPGDIVRLNDRDLSLTNQLCRVDDVVVSTTNIEVELRLINN